MLLIDRAKRKNRNNVTQKRWAAIAPVVEMLEGRQLFSVLAGWEIGPVTAASGPLAVNDKDANVAAGPLTLGAAAASGTASTFGASGWGEKTSEAAAVAANETVGFTVTAATGFTESFSSIGAYNIRRSATGPSTGVWQYEVGSSGFVDIPSSAWSGASVTTSAGNAEAAINLSGISALQNVAGGTTVSFRIVNWGDTNSGGTWYFNGRTAGDDLFINGTTQGTQAGTPVIGGFNTNPSSVGAGPGTTTLTATGVVESGGTGNITSVAFYLESDGTAGLDGGDTLIGNGTKQADGTTWTLPTDTSGLSTGTHTYYAVATDNASPAKTATATTTLNVVAAPNISFSTANYNANEADGTATITVNLTSPASTDVTVNYATSDGTPFASSAQVDGSAKAGSDYTAVNSTLTIAAGQSSGTFTVSLNNIKTFTDTANTRTLNLTLSSPSGALLGATSTATLTITDNPVTAPNGMATPTGRTSYTSELNSKVTTTVANSYLALDSSSTSGITGGPSAPFLEFSPTQTDSDTGDFPFPGTYATSTVDSVKLSLYNTTVGTGGFSGIAGKFDVYVLTGDADTAGTLPTYTYQGDGTTGPGVVGSQGTPLLVGSAQFTSNVVGYNDFIFDNLSSGVQTALTNALNNKTPIRFVITPSAGSTVSADWEGNFSTSTTEQPILTLLSEKANSVVENFSLDKTTDIVNKGDQEVVTIDRSGSDLSDSADITVNTANGSAVAGTDYTAVSQSVHFNGGDSQASFTISTASTALSADKTFTVSISSPTVDGSGHVASLASPITETISIHDPRTTNLTAGTFDQSQVSTTGPSTAYFDIEGTANTTHASFGVLDFNSPNDGGSALTVPAGQSVGDINSLTLGTVATNPQSFTKSGPINIYIVTDTTTDISPTNTSLTFQSADPEGVNGQLGTEYLLGTINFDAAQPSGVPTYYTISLASANPAGLALLKADLTSGSKIRLVLTPGSTTVGATWAPESLDSNFQDVGTTLGINYSYDSGTFALDSSTASVNEDAGTVSLTVDRTGGTTGAVDVAYHTTDGTATAPGDYTGIPTGVVHFADGQTTATITVAITDDMVHESDETFGVTLDSITPTATTGTAVLGATTFSTVTIVDNDAASALPSWLTPDSAATWDGTTLTVTGQASIIADPANAAAIVVDGSNAHLDITATAGPNVHINGLTIENGGKVDVDDTTGNANNTTLVINGALSVDVASNSVLDMWNNDMLIKNGSYSDVNTMLASGVDFGLWDGAGMRSSSAAAAGNTGLGVLTGDEFLNNNFVEPGQTFHGETVDSSDIVIKYTKYGDSNLDGQVNDDDLFVIFPAYTTTQTGDWLAGDSNYDGQVNDDDLFQIFGNYTPSN